ncbi:hypothetical protein EDD16DRAFT_1480373, partial [Pisolithus croceorrhizus]
DWITPASLIDQLNLFSGKLYLCNYNTYLWLGHFLCVYANDLTDKEHLDIESDGFITPVHHPLEAQSVGSFQHYPLPFLNHDINLCRRGVDFVATHRGKFLNGQLLNEEDFNDQWESA